MIVHFDVTQAREIEILDENENEVLVTFLDGEEKTYKGKNAKAILETVKKFYSEYEPYSIN